MGAKNPKKSHRVDWDTAEAFWLGLGPARTFVAVAEQFAVSDTRVRTVARQRGWPDKAEALDAEAVRRARQRIVRSRADRVRMVLGLVDGALDSYHEDLEEKAREAKLRELPELVKLAELLEGEATDRVSFAELQEALGVVMAIAVEYVPAKARGEFLGKVRDRLGAIGSSEADAA